MENEKEEKEERMQDTMAITRLSATHATFGIICFQSVLLSCFVFFFQGT